MVTSRDIVESGRIAAVVFRVEIRTLTVQESGSHRDSRDFVDRSRNRKYSVSGTDYQDLEARSLPSLGSIRILAGRDTNLNASWLEGSAAFSLSKESSLTQEAMSVPSC